jgi:hypothetical protein
MTLRKAALLLLVLLLGTCNQAIMTAPPGSNFAGGTLIANPGFIAAHGDVSVISGLVLRATGDPVVDGTVVQFFTNLGKIDPQGKTNDGVVRVNLVSDSRSGKATVSAFSGGGATVTPSPSPSVASDGAPVVAFSTGSVTGASDVLATAATASVEVTIGSALPDHVLLTANPPRITTGTSTTLLAQVFDLNGNPVANVPVIFQITASTVQGRLDSGGSVVFTDNDGRATDVLRTNSTVAGSITVTATTANGKTNTPALVVPVFINP